MNGVSSGELSPQDLITEPPDQVVAFDALSPSVQQRFVACTEGRSAPRPILVDEPRSKVVPACALSMLMGVVGLAVLLCRGFGRLDRASALHGTATLPLYALALAAVALGCALLLRHVAAQRALPYRRARYLFPLALVDARTSRLHVLPLSEVVQAERDGREVVLVSPSAAVIRLRARDDDEAARALVAAKLAATLAAETMGRTTMTYGLDPLQRARISSPLGVPSARGRARWSPRALAATAVLATLLAPPLRIARDRLSDRALFAEALRRNDVSSLRAYLALGGRRSDVVLRALLPRAELREAEREGTVEAVDRFARSHAGMIVDEVAAARRRAMLDELARAEKAGTVAALQELARRRPAHGLEPELRAAMHGLFAPALQAYRNKPMRSPEVRAFVERLFAWSEAKAHAGSAATTIQIRFRRQVMPSMRRADKMVAEHHWFIGEASYPSRYFDAVHAQVRERRFGEALGKRVRDAFGAAVFTVEVGPRLDDVGPDGGPLPAVTEPTLFVTHAEDWRGTFDGSITRPRGIWVGLTHTFSALFVIPDDPHALAFELELPRPIPFELVRAHPEGGRPGAPLEEKIYGSMADDAFAAFTERLAATLLPPQGS